ncbi:MAG: hypothetical protein V1897_18930, partial [Pseudomonadota bacterium]
MGRAKFLIIPLLVCLAIYTLVSASSEGVDKDSLQSTGNSPTYVAPKGPKEPSNAPSFDIDRIDRIEAAVVHPFKSANVGTEVKGVIEKINFEEGEPVVHDAVVLEILPDRYKLLAKKAEQRVKGLELSLKNSEEDLKTKEELFSLNA